MGPKSKTWYPSKRRGDRQIQGDKDDVQMGAEIAVTLPQAKEHLELPELEEARRDPVLALSEGACP